MSPELNKEDLSLMGFALGFTARRDKEKLWNDAAQLLEKIQKGQTSFDDADARRFIHALRFYGLYGGVRPVKQIEKLVDKLNNNLVKV